MDKKISLATKALIDAQNLISDPDKWHQGSSTRVEKGAVVARCAMSALAKVSDFSDASANKVGSVGPIYAEAESILEKVALRLDPDVKYTAQHASMLPVITLHPVAKFNDTHPHEDVMQMFREAIQESME